VGGEEVLLGWKEETPMTKLLIDNDEEGDEDTGPDRLALAIDRLSDASDDEMDEVTRLRAINQELVTALKDIYNDAVGCYTDPLWIVRRDLILNAFDALQHAETRTP
jgi:hypothetical protein